MKIHRLLLAVVVAAILALLLAVPAQAAIDDVEFIGATYSDTDPFYGVDVVGYTYTADTETTGTVVAQIENDTGEDISVVGASLEFDWGGTPVTGSTPSTIADGEAGFATFSFTVPSNDVASNQATHDYTIRVEFVGSVGGTAAWETGRQYRENENLGATDGVTTDFTIGNTPIEPGSVGLYLYNATDETREPVSSDAYEVDYWTGAVTFTSAPEAGDVLLACYEQIDLLGTGDWYATQFDLNMPYMPGAWTWGAHASPASLHVYMLNDSDEWSEVTNYTLDRENGQITFDTAPGFGENIIAGYDCYAVWQNTGNNFVIYSSDQNTAMAANDQYAAAVAAYAGLFGITEAAPAKTRELISQAAEQVALGDQDFEAGNFADARTHYQSALELLEDAIDADKDLVKQNLSVSSIAVWLAGFGILILGAGMMIYAIKSKKSSAPAEPE